MNSQSLPVFPSPGQLADEAVRDVLQTQWDGLAALRLDSPPGAGKTGIAERLAVQSLALLRERCMVATMTNEQTFDIARRLARGYPRLFFTLFVRDDLALPDDLVLLPNLRISRNSAQIPASGPCVVIANAARWSWSDTTLFAPFDLQIVDEAFQLPDYRFQQIAGLARRLVLVGDPGQIPPVITCEIERWKTNPSGPQVPCPRALLARYPTIRQMMLPVSRRLVPDTVELVQPAFYPTLPFRALSISGERGLETGVRGTTRLDRVIDLVERGASIVQLELPPAVTGDVDEELSQVLVDVVQRLIQRQARLRDGGVEEALEPQMIGIVCAHVSQVNAVRERLPVSCSDVLVETADRFQGLERPLMFVYHPLSGRTDGDQFHLDSGRMCVALSRHRIACVVVTRAGIEELLLRYAPSGDRVLGSDEDREYEGWRAQLFVTQELRRRGRVVALQ